MPRPLEDSLRRQCLRCLWIGQLEELNKVPTVKDPFISRLVCPRCGFDFFGTGPEAPVKTGGKADG